VRREEVERHVAPVVPAVLGIELIDRQQLDDGDAKFLEIGDLLHHPGERASGGVGHA
jgi:hypothetical protein